MTRQITNLPSFDGTIEVDHLYKGAELQLKLREVALEIEDYDAAMLYYRTAQLYSQIINMVTQAAIMASPLVNIFKELPLLMPELVALNMDTAQLKLDFKNAQEVEFIEMTAGTEAHKEVLKATIRNPKTKDRITKYKERIAEVVRQTRMEGVDLFAINKKKEKEIRNKLSKSIKLTDEEQTIMFAKGVRETLLEMISNGGRKEAVSYITDFLFRHESYTQEQAHLLLDGLKDHYKINEPKQTLNINFISVEELPEKRWLFIQYKTIEKKGEIEKEKLLGSLARYNEALGMVNPNGIRLCDPTDIIKYRVANKYEVIRIEDILKNI